MPTQPLKIHWSKLKHGGVVGRALCGKNTPPKYLTTDQSLVTCKVCRDKLGLIFTDAELDAAAKFVIQGAAALDKKNPSARAVRSLLGVDLNAEPQHPDDIAVDLFAAEMKRKLAKKREQGYGGWDKPFDITTGQGCSIDFLWHSLKQHIAKGDPVDVGNFAMMIYNRMRVAQ